MGKESFTYAVWPASEASRRDQESETRQYDRNDDRQARARRGQEIPGSRTRGNRPRKLGARGSDGDRVPHYPRGAPDSRAQGKHAYSGFYHRDQEGRAGLRAAGHLSLKSP